MICLLSLALGWPASALAGERYRYAPVSPLYLYGRPQDLALQRARDNIHQRKQHHDEVGELSATAVAEPEADPLGPGHHPRPAEPDRKEDHHEDGNHRRKSDNTVPDDRNGIRVR